MRRREMREQERKWEEWLECFARGVKEVQGKYKVKKSDGKGAE